ncbi:UDP-glucuronic acid dehydrogenase [Desulfobacter hydrogenophilus]|uniref:UDP-glucuronic acid dehydrogenase n=1 Tax=Desulfobacter hydrogenophilus TaxID=2291 RepID=A0A328F853_9BACT|nr:formyltransferase family protein [Desulfobacter hydrogenophilus]NDY73273.1 UDP-glucuronic acid dehydrogenase [Desulfobacter hydrogenophilus]QBH13849.1 UDP-glucuronic acid dehydrogenase [Desulfobacter hydrogenophilus]RAM00864.1 UDP-glucuronic acid dehydrogenase [Desulfobacter hydrogenophilus]
MKISLLCSDPNHPVNAYLLRWIERNEATHAISLVRSKKYLSGGDILFLVSCSEIIGPIERKKYRSTLVLHASKLPHGRGWSPHIWQIIGGAKEITLSLLEAENAVDTGRIWHQVTLSVPKHALWDEINEQLFNAEISSIDFAVKHFEKINPVEQNKNIEPSYFPKRKPIDSKIDPKKSILSQFDLIRVCDPNRFPAYFELHGHKYKLQLEKIRD